VLIPHGGLGIRRSHHLPSLKLLLCNFHGGRDGEDVTGRA
jgi:hypothetical protein